MKSVSVSILSVLIILISVLISVLISITKAQRSVTWTTHRSGSQSECNDETIPEYIFSIFKFLIFEITNPPLSSI